MVRCYHDFEPLPPFLDTGSRHVKCISSRELKSRREIEARHDDSDDGTPPTPAWFQPDHRPVPGPTDSVYDLEQYAATGDERVVMRWLNIAFGYGSHTIQQLEAALQHEREKMLEVRNVGEATLDKLAGLVRRWRSARQ